MNKIIIKDKNTDTVLDEFSIQNSEMAHKRAMEYEELDVDVEIIFPATVQQLGSALGASKNALQKLSCELDQEVESHK